jgi:hypothetical protein
MIPVQKLTGTNFSGPTLVEKYKEVVVTSAGRNAIATFSWPEVFEPR